MGKKHKNRLGNCKGLLARWNRNSRQDAKTVEQVNCQHPNEDSNSTPLFIPSPKAVIYASELEFIAKCIQDYPNIETGGQLFGAWTASGAPRVIYAIGPGPKANHESAFFNQDVDYLETIGARLKEYGLQHIGEWHSHHKLGLSSPSGHDAQTMQNGIVQLNLNRMLLCIGSITDRGIVINPFNFARDARFTQAQWEVINTRNRLRSVIDRELASDLCFPNSLNCTFAEQYIAQQKIPVSNESGWFACLENRMAFKQIVDEVRSYSWAHEVVPQISSEGIVSLKLATRAFVEVIRFPDDFPNVPFIIDRMGLAEGTCDHFVFENEWESGSDVHQVFVKNYIKHLKNHP